MMNLHSIYKEKPILIVINYLRNLNPTLPQSLSVPVSTIDYDNLF